MKLLYSLSFSSDEDVEGNDRLELTILSAGQIKHISLAINRFDNECAVHVLLLVLSAIIKESYGAGFVAQSVQVGFFDGVAYSCLYILARCSFRVSNGTCHSAFAGLLRWCMQQRLCKTPVRAVSLCRLGFGSNCEGNGTEAHGSVKARYSLHVYEETHPAFARP